MINHGVNLVLHVDDIGMHQATIDSFKQLYQAGILRSGSLMANCPWFSLAVKLQSKLQQADLGLHFTLNSEWDNYRWGPVAPASFDSPLVDSSGVYLHQTTKAVCERVTPAQVEAELRAQIELAFRLGFKPSHFDCHMFCAAKAQFLPTSLELALEYQIPLAVSYQQITSLSPKQQHAFKTKLAKAKMPIFDSISGLHIESDQNDILKQLETIISQLPEGLHYLYSHPLSLAPEVDMTSRQKDNRLAEFNALMQTDWPQLKQKYQINLVTFDEIRASLQ